MGPWDAMVQLSDGELKIAHTNHLVTRFREIRDELVALRSIEGFKEFVPAWLSANSMRPIHFTNSCLISLWKSRRPPTCWTHWSQRFRYPTFLRMSLKFES